MKKALVSFFAVVFLLLLPGNPAKACLNNYELSPRGVKAKERSQTLIDELTKHPKQEPWPERRERLQKALAAGGDYKVKNDLAVALLHVGETAPAVALLKEIEKEKPGLYMTAANLGTAYELSGENTKALEWIRKGIELNPRAHDGSEWLHVKILEAKIAMAADANWMRTNTVLGRSFDEKETLPPLRGNRGEPLTEEQVKRSLKYQLHERLQFVKDPDFVVGNLLVDLGTLVAKESLGVGAAVDVYRLGMRYLILGPEVGDGSTAKLLFERAKAAAAREDFGYRQPDWWARNRERVFVWGFVLVGGGALIVGVMGRRLRRQW